MIHPSSFKTGAFCSSWTDCYAAAVIGTHLYCPCGENIHISLGALKI